MNTPLSFFFLFFSNQCVTEKLNIKTRVLKNFAKFTKAMEDQICWKGYMLLNLLLNSITELRLIKILAQTSCKM